MRSISAFLRLVRWPNLIFIALTQALFYYFIVGALLENNNTDYLFLRKKLFLLLVITSVLVAAAGYIINDYFDVNIDAINKPGRVVIGKWMNRRWAILFHLLFSFTGIILSIYISRKTGAWVITAGNVGSVFLLWFYSTTFKKKLLSGNVIISVLTAWVIVVVYFFSGARILDFEAWQNNHYPFDIKKLYKLTLLYAGFAFIISLIREVVKDLEDLEGDLKYGCKTLPLVWGIPAAKIFCAVWLAVLVAALLAVIIYAFLSGWWLSAVYCIGFILLPLIRVTWFIFKARAKEDYFKISSYLKLIMLAGIISMVFFKFLP